MSLNQKVNVVVLAESGGHELEPLSAQRTKAAIPFGSKYRIIDFALANCLHSGFRIYPVQVTFAGQASA